MDPSAPIFQLTVLVSYRGGGKGDKGWVFGRDEQGRIAVSSNSRFLTERSKTENAEDAAAEILVQLGTSPSPKDA